MLRAFSFTKTPQFVKHLTFSFVTSEDNWEKSDCVTDVPNMSEQGNTGWDIHDESEEG